MESMTLDLAMEMALIRTPGGTLPFWSRLAIAELARSGTAYADLMQLFAVGRSTIYRAIHKPCGGFCPLSGRRLLSSGQSALVKPADC